MASQTGTARLVHFFTRPPRSPLLQLSVYYTSLVLLGVVLVRFVPVVAETIAGGHLADPGGPAGLSDLLASPAPARGDYLLFDLRMAVTMLGTLLITIPMSWGYMAMRERTGYEQSVVQTLVMLPVVVGGIMMVVQNSLALAFALGGVAAAVRFRNTLKDVADATFVFLALGLGIAAGSGALSAALVMSAAFTYASIMLWRCNYGVCPSAQAEAALTAPPAPRKAVRGEFAVAVRDDGARGLIEDALASSAKRWKLKRTSLTPDGTAQLHYGVRLKRSSSVDALSAALLAHADAGVGTATFVAKGLPSGQ